MRGAVFSASCSSEVSKSSISPLRHSRVSFPTLPRVSNVRHPVRLHEVHSRGRRAGGGLGEREGEGGLGVHKTSLSFPFPLYDLSTPPPPPPVLRTNWTRRVPRPVLIGHAASFTPY